MSKTISSVFINQNPNAIAPGRASRMDKFRNWWQRWKGPIRMWTWLFVTVGFMLFILEEGSQLLGFGRYTLIGGKLWKPAAEAVERDWAFNRFNKKCAFAACFINPIAGLAFHRYFGAEEQKLEREMTRINSELEKIDSRVRLIEGKVDLISKKIEAPDSKLLSNLPHLRVQAQPAPKMKSLLETNLRPSVNLRPVTKEETKVSVVYATQFGKKYHKKTCGSVSGKQVRAISVREALLEGLEACKRCRP